MFTLFDIDPVMPTGFSYHPNFISVEEEIGLLAFIAAMQLQPMKFHQYEARRRVAGFGKGWSFTEQQIKEGTEIPGDFTFLITRIAEHLQVDEKEFVQLLITEYPVGAVINWHRDAPPFDVIAGISLKADCNFKMRPQEKTKQTRSATLSLQVRRRSLYCMRGEAKTGWQHCTAPLKEVRYSLTFRTLKAGSLMK